MDGDYSVFRWQILLYCSLGMSNGKYGHAHGHSGLIRSCHWPNAPSLAIAVDGIVGTIERFFPRAALEEENIESWVYHRGSNPTLMITRLHDFTLSVSIEAYSHVAWKFTAGPPSLSRHGKLVCICTEDIRQYPQLPRELLQETLDTMNI